MFVCTVRRQIIGFKPDVNAIEINTISSSSPIYEVSVFFALLSVIFVSRFFNFLIFFKKDN